MMIAVTPSSSSSDVVFREDIDENVKMPFDTEANNLFSNTRMHHILYMLKRSFIHVHLIVRCITKKTNIKITILV
jgi:hypothetical protein